MVLYKGVVPLATHIKIMPVFENLMVRYFENTL